MPGPQIQDMEVAAGPSEVRVSLVMPVWEPRADWLRTAVRTALAQTGCEFELIVVDDGCTIPVERMLARFHDPRLRVIRVEHGGASRARNVGIAEARGSHLRFIDADDAIEPGSTARLLKLAEGRDDLIAYGATEFCDQDLNPVWRMTSRVQGDAVEACLLGRFTTRPHAFLFPRGIVERTGEWSEEIPVSADWDFILRTLEHAPVHGTTEVATLYRRHPEGLTADPEKGERGAEMVVDRYFERHPNERGSRLERRARARLLAHAGRVHMTHDNRSAGVRQLVSATLRYPRAAATEVRQAMPALIGKLRLRLRRRRGRVSPAGS